MKNGEIVLDPGVRLPDEAEVRIELETTERPASQRDQDPLFQMADLAVETGISDLATNIDHYLYGHPKSEMPSNTVVLDRNGWRCYTPPPTAVRC